MTNDSSFASESYVANAIENAQQDYATIDDLNNKVDKVVGKSLISDSEIERLANITNYDDTEIKNLLNSKADKGVVHTKVSQLTNDSGYINKIPEEYITETKLNDKNYATQNELATGLSNLENAKAEKSDVLRNYVFQKYPYTFEKSVEIAKENRPDLKALNASIKAMKQYVLLTKRQYLPDLKGGVGYSYANNRYYADSGMNVSLNLNTTFNMKQVKHEIDIANSQLNLAKTEVDLLNQNLYFDIQKIYKS